MALRYIFSIAQTTLVVRAVLSWFQTTGIGYQLYEVTCALTEPFVRPVRRTLEKFLPPSMQVRFDFSLIATMVLIELLRILFL